MITRNRYDLQGDMSYQGLSTDTKPTENVPINALFLELDTGDFYFLETPAQSGTKEILIPEMSFTGELEEDIYAYYIEGTAFFNEKTTVIFDGQKYDMTGNITEDDGYKYSFYGEFDDNYDPSFGIYPFAIYGNEDKENEQKGTFIYVQDDNEHTIEVSAESTIPAVWKKVGSGGSTPQTELPKITISMTPNDATTVLNNVNCFYDGGDPVYYDKYGNEIDTGTWGDMITFNSNETKTVIAYGKETEGIYDTNIGRCINFFESATSSNEVNCTYEDGMIEITDPTQDASISLSVQIEGLG